MKSRNTKQKEILNNEIEKIKSFFTAEYLHKKVLNKDSKIGVATVYRFLSDLKKRKKINSYICNRKQIFSKTETSHCHFICEKTGKTKHFEIDNLDFLKNKIPGSISSFQIEVKGICDECSAINDKHKH